MSKYCWLRTSMKTFRLDGLRYSVLRAVRNDGQWFAAWSNPTWDGMMGLDWNEPIAKVRTKEIRKDLRKQLDLMLDDPALPKVEAANLEKRMKLCSLFKGKRGWVEEPPRHRWLRTQRMGERDHPTVWGARNRLMRALRDDGQLFAAWGKPNGQETPEDLRKVLDTMLSDPPMRFVELADERQREHYRNMYKGEADWVEEPEHSDD